MPFDRQAATVTITIVYATALARIAAPASKATAIAAVVFVIVVPVIVFFVITLGCTRFVKTVEGPGICRATGLTIIFPIASDGSRR